MKRIFVSLSLLLAVGLTQVFADDEIRISKTVKESFKKEFAGANKVEWSRVDDHVRALFVLDRHRVVAYFNVNGELEGFGRGLLFDEMPLAASMSLDKHFAGADFINILEVSNTDGMSYWLTVATPKKWHRVKVDATGNILIVEKAKNQSL